MSIQFRNTQYPFICHQKVGFVEYSKVHAWIKHSNYWPLLRRTPLSVSLAFPCTYLASGCFLWCYNLPNSGSSTWHLQWSQWCFTPVCYNMFYVTRLCAHASPNLKVKLLMRFLLLIIQKYRGTPWRLIFSVYWNPLQQHCM